MTLNDKIIFWEKLINIIENDLKSDYLGCAGSVSNKFWYGFYKDSLLEDENLLQELKNDLNKFKNLKNTPLFKPFSI